MMILYAIGVLVIFYFLYRYAMDSPLRVDMAVAKSQIHSYDVILDVRTSAERALLGYYPGSVHVPGTDLETQAQNVIPSRNSHILIYCNTGQRARAAAEKLQKMGYANVQYIAGSYVSLM